MLFLRQHASWFCADLVAGSKRRHLALCKNKRVVDSRERIGTMRDNYNNRSFLPHGRDGIGQGILSLGIEARIRLIENNEERISE